ncbi:three-Cys-motif partner protein TcmP [Pararhizobium sp. BT-229]|uniref:three-Cys-motif partner protein TcmP n=1 Tax=Pararhizobium sp. BT-229 TaxID=2986923 RepID=UPI0021F741D2|nr:three-Cys-motif partner protein TcmP [Pararhizobium sp. BT-229]MCV9960361.1 three-Cys-motif partner protein TcmP [Pararhizobium sp. BT-229]
MSDHEFGNVSTDLKLSLVESYLSAFSTALRSQFSELWYIDAFAGTGERVIKHDAVPAGLFPEIEKRVERRRGSAKIALDITPAFDRIVFMEKKRSYCKALEALKAQHPTRRIDVVRGDANTAIEAEIEAVKWTGKRGVMFLDPYGMAVNWSTLERIRATEAIDVWYLVSLAGLFRQATRDRTKIEEKKRAAITRMLGTGEWESVWYNAPIKQDLFGKVDENLQRIADVEAIETFVGNRLSDLFPKVLKPKRLKNAAGLPMFSLFLAISNPNGKAIGLATRIGNSILKS